MNCSNGILEVAILEVKKGLVLEFQSSFLKAKNIIKRAKGYYHHSIRKCIESESQYILRFQLESLENNEIGFKKSEYYKKWKALLHHYYEPYPIVEHYQCLS